MTFENAGSDMCLRVNLLVMDARGLTLQPSWNNAPSAGRSAQEDGIGLLTITLSLLEQKLRTVYSSIILDVLLLAHISL